MYIVVTEVGRSNRFIRTVALRTPAPFLAELAPDHPARAWMLSQDRDLIVPGRVNSGERTFYRFSKVCEWNESGVFKPETSQS